ncbi:MAG: ribosome biogenesis GTP-binding protein YihA/YsxC [Gemmatimonadaceae bacterium]
MSPHARADTADPLVVRHIEFLGGMAGVPGAASEARRVWRPPSTLPEVAFGGRSNVGKSSLLNALVRRKAIARVSRTPGRTREINFFEVNGEFLLVDLPGYGYARASKAQRAAWRPLIQEYLRDTATLRGLVLLLDVRRDPTPDDEQMLAFLAERALPVLVAVTKIDKLSPRAAEARIAELSASLGLAPEQVVPFSAVTGAGRDELAAAVVELVRG